MAGILHVCTANRCRSAVAERLTRAALPGDVPVTSAGLRAVPGQDIWPEAAQELERRGVSALGFDSHPLHPALVAGADVVLTATRAQRDQVVAEHPAALRRTFTWRELAWLVRGMTPADLAGGTAAARIAELPVVAGRRRGAAAPPSPQLLDVADPVGGAAGAVAVAVREIEDALRPVLDLVRARPVS